MGVCDLSILCIENESMRKDFDKVLRMIKDCGELNGSKALSAALRSLEVAKLLETEKDVMAISKVCMHVCVFVYACVLVVNKFVCVCERERVSV